MPKKLYKVYRPELVRGEVPGLDDRDAMTRWISRLRHLLMYNRDEDAAAKLGYMVEIVGQRPGPQMVQDWELETD